MLQPKIQLPRIQLYADLIFFLVFFPLVITLVPVDRWLVYRPIFVITLTAYLLLLYLAYRYVNIPRMLLHRQWLRGLGCVVVVLLCTWLFVYIFEGLNGTEDDVLRRVRSGVRIHSVWFLTLIVTGYSFSNNLLIELFKLAVSVEAIEGEKNKAELAMYKAQINPHFLFNTLNTLYGLLITHSDKAAAAFEEFISLIKYMYSNANRDFIPLSEEMDYIRQYVALQSLRLNECTKVCFEHDISKPSMPVPPMLLITFVENAFKYGVSSGDDSYIRIVLRQEGDTLLFKTENRIMTREHKESKKMGIDNCRRRLRLLYPENHRLRINTDDDVFRVELEINAGNEHGWHESAPERKGHAAPHAT